MALTLMNKGKLDAKQERDRKGRGVGRKGKGAYIYMIMEQKGKPHYSGALIKSCTGINNQTHAHTYKYTYTYTILLPKKMYPEPR